MTITSKITSLLISSLELLDSAKSSEVTKRRASHPSPELERLETRCLLSGQALPISTEILALNGEEGDSPLELLLGKESGETVLDFGSKSSGETFSSSPITLNSEVPASTSKLDAEVEHLPPEVFGNFEEELMLEQEAESAWMSESGVEILDDGTRIIADPASSVNSSYSTTLTSNSTTVEATNAEDISLSIGPIKQRFSVKDFGAVGDGLTDDTAAIQAALDAAAGQELYLDEGTYLVTDALLISSNTRLIGAGSASVLKFNWRDGTEGETYHLGNRNRTNESNGDYNIELYDFKLVGGDSGDPYGVALNDVTHGISFRKVTNVVVSGVEIEKTSGFAICNVGLINGTFTNNLIQNVGRDGITSFPLIQEDDPDFAGYNLEGLVISNNRFYNLGDDAIAVHAGTWGTVNYNHPPRNITISDNIIVGRLGDHELAQGRGIVLTGVYDATITGNEITNTTSTGITIAAWYNASIDPEMTTEAIRSNNILLSNNTLLSPGMATGLPRSEFGIQVKGSNQIQILNNIIRDSANRGIDIRNVTDADIIGNEVTGSLGNVGILLGGGDNYDVVNATVRNNTVEHWNSDGVKLYHVINGIQDSNLVSVLA
ncbi:MAG: right-handed parallel beta-helix repeat-containing protein [Planctomycetaceae bacterium]|nr:right-handed parallel beta-helix repeat-containing protein [Planctomycetaceae bacterium]